MRAARLVVRMDTDHQQSAHEELVVALMQSAGQIALIVSHMADFSAAGRAAASAPGFDAVLRHIATDVLEASLHGAADDELRAAARLVMQATDVLGEQLVLVPPEADLPRMPPSIPRHRRRPL